MVEVIIDLAQQVGLGAREIPHASLIHVDVTSVPPVLVNRTTRPARQQQASSGQRHADVASRAPVVQHGSRANWRPHLRLRVTDDGFRPDGTFVSSPVRDATVDGGRSRTAAWIPKNDRAFATVLH